MPIKKLYDEYDARLRAGLRRMGIADPLDQEDLAQNVWTKLAARSSLPQKPAGWIFKVAQREAIRFRRREARRKAWQEQAVARGTAGGGRPFNIEQALLAVRERLSDRDEDILVATVNCRTDEELRDCLGYPSVKNAQSVRSRVHKRVKTIVRSEVDVSFMFDGLAVGATQEPTAVSDTPESIWTNPEQDILRASAEGRGRILAAATHVRDVAAQSRDLKLDRPPFGSFAHLFADVLRNSASADWSEALNLHQDDVALLGFGDLTVLEINPDEAVTLAQMLGLTTEDLAALALADLGARPIVTASAAHLKEAIFPREEIDIRLEGLREAAAVLEAQSSRRS
jgi:DNA-directed RNA polymerase specialized sigma24 family protein